MRFHRDIYCGHVPSQLIIPQNGHREGTAMVLWRKRWLVVIVSLVFTTGGAEPASADPAAADIPDACGFLTRDEIAEAIGRNVREGEHEEVPAGTSQCRYSTTTSSVTVTTTASDPAQFDEFRDLIGPEVEIVEGIGDGAYFWGPNLIYVRVGNRGFSLRINEDLGDGLRPAMLTLAKRGAARLQ